MQGNTAEFGGGALFFGCSNPSTSLVNFNTAISNNHKYGGIHVARNRAGYGNTIATRVQSFESTNNVTSYRPGDFVATILRLADGFGQTTALLSSSQTYIVAITACRGSPCAEGGAQVMRFYQGFNAAGVVDTLSAEVALVWPAQTNNSAEKGRSRRYEEDMFLSHEILSQVSLTE